MKGLINTMGQKCKTRAGRISRATSHEQVTKYGKIQYGIRDGTTGVQIRIILNVWFWLHIQMAFELPEFCLVNARYSCPSKTLIEERRTLIANLFELNIPEIII